MTGILEKLHDKYCSFKYLKRGELPNLLLLGWSDMDEFLSASVDSSSVEIYFNSPRKGTRYRGIQVIGVHRDDYIAFALADKPS